MRPKIPSERIRSIVDKLRPTWPVYDLCCDHGLIGLLAWERNKNRPITFVDQSPNALIALQAELRKPRYSGSHLEVQVSSAEDIRLIEPSNIVIAGVGNATIIRILQALFPEALAPHRLVLCSQQLIEPLKTYLELREWPVREEVTVIERGRERTVLLVEC